MPTNTPSSPSEKNLSHEPLDDHFAQMRKGLLEFLVLTLIPTEPMYAKEILERLEFVRFKTQEGTLYPLLNKLKRQKLIQSHLDESDIGPPRKYYHLTATGTKRLEELNSYWKSLIETVHKLRRKPSLDRAPRNG